METPSSSGTASDQCTDNAASSSSHPNHAPRRSGGTGPRTPTSDHSNNNNDNSANGREVLAWRLMSSDQKRKVYRVHGVCQEYPQYNVTRVEDRRLTTTAPTVYNRKKSTLISLPVPQFPIDDHHCIIPPYRELSITGLNDNVDEKFLRGLCKKGEEPMEVVVFNDPKTRKHLGMAFIDFDAKWKSDVFIAKYNGRTMMGSVVTCFFDPMAYKISKIYEEITNTPVQLPKRYWNMKSSKAISAMRQMLADVYALEKEAEEAAEREKSSSEGFRNFSFHDNADVELIDLTGTPSSHTQEHTLDPSFANASFNDAARALRPEVADESRSNAKVDESDRKFRNYGFASTSTTPPNGHHHHHHVDRRSVGGSRATPARCRTPPAPAYTPLSDSKNTSVERPSHTPPYESNAQPPSNSGSGVIPLRTTLAYINQNNNNNDKGRLNGFTPMPATLPLISHTLSAGGDNRESLATATNGCNAKAGGARNGAVKRVRRTHRWSSSSESGSSDDDGRSRAKRSYHRSGDTCRLRNTPHTPTTPSFASIPSAVYTNCRSSDVAGDVTPKPLPPPSLLSPLTRLPPPGVIESPTLASGSSSQPAENSPTKQRNLEQRLVHIFGKGPNSHSTGTPSVNTPSSSSSSCAPAAAAAAYYQQPPSTASSSFADHPVRSPNRTQQHQPPATDSRFNFTAYVAPVERRKLSQAEIEAELERRATADLIRERQDKLLRCFDVSRKVHSMYSMEAHLSIKKDMYRRLDAEAFKILDAEIEARKKRRSAMPPSASFSHETKAKDTVVNRAGEARLMSMFPRIDDSNAGSIFGMPYNVRMSAMPSFKKKKPVEVRRHADVPATKKSTELSKKTKEAERTTSKKDKRLNHQIRDRNQSMESDASLLTHRKHAKKASKTQEKKRHRRSRSPSTASSSASVNDLLESIAVAEHDESTVPTTNASSEVDGEDRVDSSTMDEREKRLRDAEIGCQEEEDDSGVKKSLIEKRALLNSLLRDSTSSEETPLVENVVVDLFAADLTKLGDIDSTAKVIDDEEQAPTSSQSETDNSDGEVAGDDVAFVAVEPPSAKRPRFERQLESLLHVTVDARPPPSIESRVWPKRSEEDDLAIVNKLQESPLNEEDCAYIKVAFMRLWDHFDEMMPSDQKLTWVQPTILPIPKELPSKVSQDNCEFYYDDADLYNVVPHKTGCARTEGYYKVNRQRKRLLRRFDNETSRTDISTQDETAIRHKVQASKDERAMNRRLKTWMGDSNLVRVNQLKYRGKMIKFARSRIHGWGLYAMETIMPEEMIIEYVGEKIRPTVADEREKNYERRGMGSSYMFRIDGDAVIDATKKGNYGRFINHSCMPNCTARVVMVEGEKRIVIYSKRLIERGEEITYDYKFAREDEASKIECLCGARSCQKYLN